MVDFIGTSRMQALVSHVGVARFIHELSYEIEKNYLRWEAFSKSPRHATHSSVGVIELMPAANEEHYAFKYVNGHPKNGSQGLLTVMAFGVLSQVKTGYPLVLSEMTLLTALRTAATSVMAARHLARKNSSVMALIGNGAQSEFQAIGFYHDIGIRKLRLFDVDRAATDKLVANLSALQLPGLELTVCTSAEEAAKGADIITTATADKRNAVILTPSMVRPGMHLNAVGGDCPGKTELHAKILVDENARIFVEYESQSRIEGEIQQLSEDYPVTELADLFTGRKDGRMSDADITIFDSVGFALEDFSALSYAYQLNRQAPGEKETVELIPALEDPKDLFSLVKPKNAGVVVLRRQGERR